MTAGRKVAAVVFILIFAIAMAGAALYYLMPPLGPSLSPVNLSAVLTQLRLQCSSSSTNFAWPLLDSIRVVNSSYLKLYGVPYEYSAAVLGQGSMRLGGYRLSISQAQSQGGFVVYRVRLYQGSRLVNSTYIDVASNVEGSTCSYATTAQLGNVSLVVITHYGEAYLILMIKS